MLWILRMARWARHPPSLGRVKLVLAVVLICAALVLIETFVGWPDWATVTGGGRMLRP